MDQQVLHQLRAELRTEFASTIDNLRGEIQAQSQLISTLQASVSATAANPPSSKRPKSSLPDPEKFSGQAFKYDTWDAAIRAKLAIDGPAIGDSTAQFYYVYLNLASQVQAMVFPQLSSARDSGIHDYNTILDSLRRVYDNPNKEFVTIIQQLTGYTSSTTTTHSNTTTSSNTQQNNDRMDLSALESGDTFDYDTAIASLRTSRD
ncbi:hypothetical protein VN97_g13280 [Penicillium thymicola]|uniref:Uncharacterized protein n=1 Tax=Penicillium thymicola TaxID=293382 RepID=A0AAI9T4W0_PENTH|nr:hypothetical protein VN97_g13280 [Penicillium thymicola]